MKNFLRSLTIALALALFVSAVGCSAGTNNNPSDNSGTSADSSMVRMMKMLPSDSGEFYFADVKAQFADGNSALLESVAKGIDYLMTSNHIILVEYSKDFDLIQLADDIAQNSTASYDYDGIKVWVQKYGSEILLDNIEVRGENNYSIQRCIEVIKGEKPSLYDNEDFKDIADRLKGGDTIGIADSSYSSNSYAGFLAQGASQTKQNMTVIYKFNSSATAQQYVKSIEDELAGSLFGEGTNANFTRDGAFVIAIAKFPEAYIPTQSNESKYLTAKEQVQNAVTAYTAHSKHPGQLPILAGTYTNANCSSCKVVNMSTLLVINDGMLRSCPDGLWQGSGSSDDNCDATGGSINGCSNSNHYIWIVNNYGDVYSYCKGSSCKTNNSGYQGVWP